MRRPAGRPFGAARGEVGAGAEVAAAAAQHHDADIVVAGESGELRRQLLEHALVEGIAAIGAIERTVATRREETSTEIVCNVTSNSPARKRPIREPFYSLVPS